MTTRRAYNMRNAEKPESMVRNHGKLLKYLEKDSGNKIPTRSVALESTGILAKKAELRSVNPTEYARMAEVLRQEIKAPKATGKKVTPADVIKLRSIAMQVIGSLQDQQFMAPIVDVLDSATLADKSQATAATSAEAVPLFATSLDALAPFKEELLVEGNLRNRLLTALPLVNVPDQSAKGAFEFIRLRQFFENSLYNVATVTELLNDQAARSSAEVSMLQALEWNYRLLHQAAKGEGSSVSGADLVANRDILLVLSVSDREKSPKQARTILSEFSPWHLGDLLVRQSTTTPGNAGLYLAEYINLYPLLVKLDQFYSSAENQTGAWIKLDTETYTNESLKWEVRSFAEVREEALKASWAYVDQAEPADREFVYSGWFLHGPMELTAHLAERHGVIATESPDSMMQAARLLGNLSRNDKLDDDSREKARVALARMMEFDQAPVRLLIADYLMQERPGLVVRSMVPSLRKVADQSSEGAKALLDVYTSSIVQMESDPKLAAEIEEWMTVEGDLPLPILARVFDRPENSYKRKAISFVMERDKDMATTLLSKRTGEDSATTDTFAMLILGDYLRQDEENLNAESFNGGVKALGEAFPRMTTESDALRVARFLAELKSPTAHETLKSTHTGAAQFQAVAVLVKAALAEKNQ